MTGRLVALCLAVSWECRYKLPALYFTVLSWWYSPYVYPVMYHVSPLHIYKRVVNTSVFRPSNDPVDLHTHQ